MKNDDFDPQSLIGLDKEQAFKITKDNARQFLIVKENGKGFAVPYNLVHGRLSFTIDNDKIIGVTEEKAFFITEEEAALKRFKKD